MATVAIHLSIKGQVQGVGYRYWAVREARRRGLRGWVRNRYDGTVEALLIGEEGALDAMIEASRRGPSSARVDSIERKPASDDGTPDFAERPTA